MTETPKTSISLILRLKENADAEAWQEFCDLYQPLIRKIASLGGLQESDANDFVQNVFVRVAKSVSQFDTDPDRGSFRGWLGTMARNLLIDFLRQQQRLPVTADGSGIAHIINQTPDRAQESELYDREFENQVFLWAAKHVKPSFRDTTWQAFWRTTVQQEPVSAVADELGISTGAIYIARSRVIARLRQTVGENSFDSIDLLNLNGESNE